MNLSRKARGALGTIAVVAGVGAALVAGGATSANQGTTTNPPTTTTTLPPLDEQTIYMEGSGQDLRFEFEGIAGSDELVRGEPLRIVNDTDPEAVGPHTFTLLTQSAIDRSGSPRKCFQERICGKIAQWHGATQTGVERQVVKAGRPGWDKKGWMKQKGDSWFSQTDGEAFTQELSSDQNKLRFFCAIHPNMRGQIRISDVVPTR